MDHRVISIGALETHPLWNEKEPRRTGSATCTLVRSGDRVILVDPGPSAEALRHRLMERAGLEPKHVSHVFLTCFRPDVRRGLALFPDATWWISEAEREAVGVPLATQFKRAEESGDAGLAGALRTEVALLQRFEVAPDSLAERVDLFPLPGVTPGLSGLLLAEPRHTTLIAGDAVPTWEHLESGAVPKWAVDGQRAKESFLEALEIADLLIPGRDNLVVNPGKRPF